MNIWIFNHYAESPDGSATRTFDLCRVLAQKGHTVTIFASSYSHYRLREEHITGPLRLTRVEMRDGVRFIWLRGFPYEANDWRRMFNMVGYGVLALVRGLATLPGPDVVIGCSVHPCAALTGLAISRLTAVPFFVEVPDLWPQVLIDFGRISPRGIPAGLLRLSETILFSASERIIMLWRNTQAYVRQRGLDDGKIVWLPHVVDPAHFEGMPEYREHAPPFLAMYVGSLVRSMALDVVLDACLALARSGRDDIRVVLIGDGSDRNRLLARAGEMNLPNLEFRGPVPKSEVPRVLAGADGLICCFKNSPVYRYGLSMNKLCDYMMSGRPVVFCGESAYDPVAEAKAGISVKGEDSAALAAALQTMADSPFELRREMGRRGMAWARDHHDVRTMADSLETLLKRSLRTDGAPA